MAASSKPILIVGSGLSGLLLAQGLKRASISFRIFERDNSPLFRPQGYRVHINHDGASAIKRTVSPELFKLFEDSCAITEIGGTRLDALTGQTQASAGGQGAQGALMGRGGPPTLGRRFGAPHNPGDLGPYTVDRTVFRAVLMHGIQDSIEFNKTFDRYSEGADGVTVHFKDGSSSEGVLLVGADGNRSSVRAQYLPEHKLLDSQGRAIYGKTTITDELLARFPAEAMKWITIIADARPLALFLEPVRFPKDKEAEMRAQGIPRPADYMYWVLGGRKEFFPRSDRELMALSHEEAVALSLDMTKDWNPAVRSLLELQDVQQASALRVGTYGTEWVEWAPSGRITLIGDAVHAMSPTGGSGANTALRGAAGLCAALVEGGINEESVGKYEREMKEYAKEAIVLSMNGGAKLFNLPPIEELTLMEY